MRDDRKTQGQLTQEQAALRRRVAELEATLKTERQQTEMALRDVTSRQQALLAAVPDILMEVNVDKIYTWANQAGYDFFGEDVIGKEAAYYFEGEQETYKKVQPIFNGKEDVFYVESWQRKKDGQKRLLAWWCRVLKDKDGEVIGALSSARDITESRQAEERLRRSELALKKAQAVSHVGSWVWHIQSNRLEWSDEMYRIFDIEKEGFSVNLLDVVGKFIHPEDRAKVEQSNLSVINHKTPIPVEYCIVRPDKSVRVVWAEAGELILDETGNPAMLTGIVQDITERKQIEEALRENEARFSTIFQASPIGAAVTRLADGRVSDVNDALLNLLGYSREEVIGHTTLELNFWSHAKDRERMTKALRKKGRLRDFEMPYQKKSDEIGSLLVSADIIDLSGEPHMLSLMYDITERKRMVQALRESEERFRLLYDHAPLGYHSLDENGRIIEVNQAWLDLVGCQRGEVIGRSFREFLIPAQQKEFPQRFLKFKEAGGAQGAEYEMLHKNGSTRLVSIDGRVVYDQAGHFLQTHCILTDITQRKRIEEALRQSEERFRSLYENATIGLYRTTPDGSILMVNPTALRMLGYCSLEELSQRNLEEAGFEPSYPRSDFRQKLEKQDAITGLESAWNRKDGSIIFVRESARAIRDENGQVLYYDGTFEDITEQKRATEALERIFAGARCLLWYAHVVRKGKNYIWDFRLSNEDSARNFLPVAVEPGQSYTNAWASSKLDEERPRLEQDYRQALKKDSSGYSHEFRCRMADGSIRWLFEDVQITAGPKNEWDFVGVCTDITERKRAEEALRRSEAQLSNAMIMAQMGSWEYDVLRDTFTFNDQFYAIFRTSAEQVGGYEMVSAEYAKRFVHPDDIEVVAAEVKKAIETTDPYYSRRLEHRIIYADGETGVISVRFFVIKDMRGRTVKTFGVNQDITERKRAEESLRRLGAAVDQTIEGIAVADMKGIMGFANPAWAQMHGYAVKDIIGKNLSIFHTPQQIEQEVLRFNNKVIESGFFQGEVGHVRKDGTIFPTLMGSSLLKDEAGRPDGIIGVAIDISDQKRAREALEESEKKYRSVIENIQDVFYRSDKSGKLVMCSPSGAKMFGYSSPEEMLGLPLETFWLNAHEREAALSGIRDKGQISDYGAMFVRKDGVAFPVSINAHFYHDEAGKIQGTEGVVRDITERKRVLEKLRESEERSNLAIEGTDAGLWDWDIPLGAIIINERWAKIIGYSLRELSPLSIKTWNELCHPDDILISNERLQKHFSGGSDRYECEVRMKHKAGHWVWVLDRGKVVAWDKNANPSRMIGTHMDITERKVAEEQIRSSLNEKEILLQELYHRTKNNMQVIRSMLKLQSYSLADESAKKVFNDMDNRINAMALVHQKLYQSENLSSISMQSYIHDLTSLLMESYRANKKIALDLKIENIAAIIDLAVPCGLLITELISNSLKHAFPGNRSGKIVVRFKRTRTGKLCLQVADNGVGFPPGYDFKQQGTLGMQMIHALGEHQLQGKVTFESKEGFCCKIQFSDELYMPRV